MTSGPIGAEMSAVPYSQDAEEAVLGAVLVNAEAFLSVASFLRAEDFFILRNAYIWEAMLRITERSDAQNRLAIDYLTVMEELRAQGRLNDIGGPAYLTQLINNTPTSVHAEVYGRLVERAATRRRLMAASDEIRALALDEQLPIERVTGEAESRLFRVTERSLRRDLVPMRDAVSEYFDRMEHLLQHPDEPLGLPTGFRDLDALLGGLQRSDLLIFAGRPGMGKCVAAGTLIATERGLLPIEALKPEGMTGIPDDEGGTFYPLEIGVQTPDGMRTTTHFYDSGVKPTLRLTTRTGYSLTGTYVHPVLVLAKSGEKVWKPLAELEPGDFVAVQRHAPVWEGWADEVAALEAVGEQPCYDLTVPDGHAFVSNGIVSHNTSFLLSVILNAAKLGARGVVFTMEMGAEQIVQRLMSMETGINTQKLRLGQLDQREWDLFVKASMRLSNLNIFIDDTPAMTPIQVRTKARRVAHEYGLDLVIIDYLQLMNAGPGYENNRVQEISYISRNLKELARELNVPVFSAAQLSRAVEARQDKRPLLSDLRESGCLAGEALVYLPDSGESVPIRDLVERGRLGFNVLALNTETWKLEPAPVSNAFCTGIKPVFKLTTQLGRTIRATANHKFLTINGWKRLDELATADCIAVPRTLPSPSEATMTHVSTTGREDIERFVACIDAVGTHRQALLTQVREYIAAHSSNTNRDIIPHQIWRMYAVPAMRRLELTSRALQAQLGNAYCGTGLYKQNVSRDRIARLAQVVQCETLAALATSDVYWDPIVSIEPDGEIDVYDLTVPNHHCFVANYLLLHNSIEQDSDIVIFLYRDSVYNEATETPNLAELIVAKHRNGPTGTVELFFEKSLTKFLDANRQQVDLSSL